MHALMGIVYGAMLITIGAPLYDWWVEPTALDFAPATCPAFLRWVLTAMGVGVFLSGVRDFCASYAWRGSAWPWKPTGEPDPGA
jgi:hypothetical protein